MNIWTVDKATIGAEIRQRNALRKSALLPLLDEQQESEHACWLIRSKRWHAFKESKQSNYERFRDEVYRKRGIPSGMMGRWAWHIEIDKRFEAFLRAKWLRGATQERYQVRTYSRYPARPTSLCTQRAGRFGPVRGLRHIGHGAASGQAARVGGVTQRACF